MRVTGEGMFPKLLLLAIATSAVFPVFGSPISVNLNSANSFGLLGGSVSNTGTSVITGSVGVKDASGTITGFNPTGTTVGGQVYAPGSSASTQAFTDFLNAYNTANLLASTQTLADLTLNRSFTGNNVYASPSTDLVSTAGITLTFDAQNDGAEVFVIQVNRDLTINGPITFALLNGAQSQNIFWIVGRTATINPVGVPIVWDGSVLAGTSVTVSSIGPSSALGGIINGCVFSENATTLAGTTDVSGCANTVTVPEPSTFGLFGIGGALLLIVRRSFTHFIQEKSS